MFLAASERSAIIPKKKNVGHPAYTGKGVSKKRGLLPAEIEIISKFVLEQVPVSLSLSVEMMCL
jgi:hypothetical protein